MKKVMVSITTILIILMACSHYRAYFYFEQKLKAIAQSAFDMEVSQYTQCDEIRFYKYYRPANLSEVVVYQWLCINSSNKNFLVASTVESDGYVAISRIVLSEEEITKLLK